MSAFHAAFEAALDGALDPLWPHLTPDGRTLGALAVYRNTAMRGRVDALQANYPCVAQMAGAEWFRAAAREYAASHCDDPCLVRYGSDFPEWLSRFHAARETPYLSPCARLDRAWTQAHLAPDVAPMTPHEAAAMGLRLTGAAPGLHPSARLFWFEWSAPSLWLAHRYPPGGVVELEWRRAAEGLLIHRPHAEVRAERLTRPEWLFLDACRKGAPFGVAAMTAQGARSSLDVAALFGRLVTLGAFASMEPARAVR